MGDWRNPEYCMDGIETNTTDEIANFGRPGCDSPRLLVETMMKKMKEVNPDLDVVLVPGDLVTHALPIGYSQHSQRDVYEKIKGVIDTVSELFETYFASAIVLPTIGNNDTEFHYNPEVGKHKDEYYKLLVNDWFTGHTANKGLSNLSDVQTSVE